MDDLITFEEFKQEVWDVEHLKIGGIEPPCSVLLPHYPYTKPMDGRFTVDEFLNTRIRPVLLTAKLPEFAVVVCLPKE